MLLDIESKSMRFLFKIQIVIYFFTRDSTGSIKSRSSSTSSSPPYELPSPYTCLTPNAYSYLQMSTHDTATMAVTQPAIHTAYYPTLLHSTDASIESTTSKIVASSFKLF